jgi:hypothetical protein
MNAEKYAKKTKLFRKRLETESRGRDTFSARKRTPDLKENGREKRYFFHDQESENGRSKQVEQHNMG